MTDAPSGTAITIPANDHGQIRVFATDQPPAKDADAALLGQLFGHKGLDSTYIDVVPIADLDGMRLSDYILQGYDLTPDAADRTLVDGITGTAILILSRATGGVEASLQLGPGLRHVTTYSPTARLDPPEPMPSVAAKGIITPAPDKPAKSDARIGGMVAMYALIALFMLVALMIWVAG